ncbi:MULTISPECIES: RodZ domain-containing protein [unclassified Shewanella]|uniref:RodZ domain-containing protein n=1 Tax=unclassified Shewanella TaxID=196818 RepID=UPI001BBFB970|nr:MULTISPECIES: RodZ domain-containing protein [unclassified Shewanella]GIU09693.1 membrane protein [Shewanella sp. MBTL60-112-B1]GIU34191.1 membrane protein [Shewanella sp. MBTL60-112-B2]
MKNEQNQEPNVDNESLVDEPTLTLGVLLKTARESKGLSIEAIAAQLHLRPTIVQEIEADNLEAVGAATYVRGYVKNYARAVQADPFSVQECLNKQLANDDEPSMQSFSRKTTRQARDGRLMALTYLIVFALLALMVWWWFQKSSLETAIDYSQPTVEEVAASEQLPEASPAEPLLVGNQAASVEQISEPVDETLQLTNENNQVADSPATISKPVLAETSQTDNSSADITSAEIAPSTTIQAEPVTAESNTGSALKLSLTGDCWIKVADATGKTLVSDLKKAGSEINLVGAEPFSVTLGAPQVVNIQLNGKAISLEQYPSGKVARLTLPLAGQ